MRGLSWPRWILEPSLSVLPGLPPPVGRRGAVGGRRCRRVAVLGIASLLYALSPQLKYPGFCSYMGARAGVGWLAGCEVPVRAASYSAGGT